MNNSLLYLFKKVNWPKRLMFSSLLLTMFSSTISLVIPIMSKKIDSFDFSVMNYLSILLFIILFLFSACLDELSLYLLSKIGEMTIYSIKEQL